MTLMLYDTARRAVVPFEPPEHVLMYTCGITPYDATHLGHAATYLAYDVLQRRLDRSRPPGDVCPQRHRRRRPAVCQGPRARCPLPRSGGGGGGPLRGRHGGAQRAARRLAATGIVGDPGHSRLHRHGHRPWLRLRGRRQRVLRRVEVRQLRDRQPLLPRRDARVRPPARRRRRQPAQARPARLRAVATLCAGRTVVGHVVGAGSPRMAHRVQRPCPARAGLDNPPARRRHRSHLPPPRMRTGSVGGGDGRAVRPALDAHGADLDGRREDVQEPRQPRLRRRPPQGVGRRSDSPWHHRPPLPHRMGVGRRIDAAGPAAARVVAGGGASWRGHGRRAQRRSGAARRRSRHARRTGGHRRSVRQVEAAMESPRPPTCSVSSCRWTTPRERRGASRGAASIGVRGRGTQ